MSHIKTSHYKRAPLDNRTPGRPRYLFEDTAYDPEQILSERTPLEVELGKIAVESNGNPTANPEPYETA